MLHWSQHQYLYCQAFFLFPPFYAYTTLVSAPIFILSGFLYFHHFVIPAIFAIEFYFAVPLAYLTCCFIHAKVDPNRTTSYYWFTEW
jgi:hypothetical protein